MPESLNKQDGKMRSLANLKPIKKGEVRNPNGRPKLEDTFSHIAREMLQAKKIDITYTFPKNGTLVRQSLHIEADKTMHHSLAAVLIKEGLAGNVKAIQEIIDRTEGKPNQKVDITTNGDNLNIPTYNFEGMSIEKQRAIRDALRAAKQL